MPRRLRGDRPHHLPASGTVASAGAQTPHHNQPLGKPGVRLAPTAGLVCCSHRLLEHRVWVSTGRTHSGGRYLAFLTPKTTSSSQAAQPGAARGRTHAVSSILAGLAQTPPRQLRPDPAARDPRPPQICWVREREKPGSGGAGCRQGQGSHPPAFPFSLASPCGRSARRLTRESCAHPGTAPTLPELFNTHLLQTKQPELLFY